MIHSREIYEKLEKNFISWAETVEDIRAAFIIGSRARNNHPSDEYSDMDIIVFSSNPDYYLTNNDWLHNIGNISTSFESTTAGGDSELLTLFDGVWQVDFVFHSVEELEQNVKNGIIPDNFYRGVKVIIDKDGIANTIMPSKFKNLKSKVLSEEMFLQSVNMFWFIALNMSKQILRNELWVVKMRDEMLKDILLQMIECHEKLIHGADYDTWHAGRFLYEWANKDVLAEIENCFGHYDRSDSWKALMSTVALFQRLSHNIAKKLNYSYPYQLEHNICEWISQHASLIKDPTR